MRFVVRSAVLAAALCALSSCQRATADADTPPEQIIAMERAALDRWGKGDPQGYIEIMADEITYFDPMQEKRVDGHDTIVKALLPIAEQIKASKIEVSRFDMIAPKVQQHGEAALLTFNLVSYVKTPDGKEVAAARWNSSELYARIGGQWRIIHSHWSYIKPELKQTVPEGV